MSLEYRAVGKGWKSLEHYERGTYLLPGHSNPNGGSLGLGSVPPTDVRSPGRVAAPAPVHARRALRFLSCGPEAAMTSCFIQGATPLNICAPCVPPSSDCAAQDWVIFAVKLPADALSPGTKLRWRQHLEGISGVAAG